MKYSKDKWLLIIRFFFSFLIIVFCIRQINTDKENIALYWGGISSVVGYWLPSPLDEN